MPRMPSEIKIVREGGNFEMTVDGQEFPWYIGRDSISTSVGDCPAVTLTILAESVEVVDRVTAPEPA